MSTLCSHGSASWSDKGNSGDAHKLLCGAGGTSLKEMLQQGDDRQTPCEGE